MARGGENALLDGNSTPERLHGSLFEIEIARGGLGGGSSIDNALFLLLYVALLGFELSYQLRKACCKIPWFHISFLSELALF